MKKVISVSNLQKSFGKRKILHDISFYIHPGEIVGFVEIISSESIKAPKYFLSNKTDFASLLFRGEGRYIDQTVNGSLMYLGTLIVVLLIVNYFIFNKMDIKNQ